MNEYKWGFFLYTATMSSQRGAGEFRLLWQLRLQLLTSLLQGWRLSLPQGNCSTLYSILMSPFFFYFFFLGFQKEVPTINKNVFFFPHCEMQQTRLLTKTFFFFSSWYFWHMKAQAMGVREGDIMFLCCLFWFTVLNTMRRSTGGEGRKTRSKVTVFNSEGISRQQPQQRRPPAARRFRRS